MRLEPLQEAKGESMLFSLPREDTRRWPLANQETAPHQMPDLPGP